MTLREDQIHRYARHVLLREVGGRGQERLLAARVLVGGEPGATLETALVYLAAAGVGTVGAPGAPAELRERVVALNPDVTVVGWEVDGGSDADGGNAQTDPRVGALGSGDTPPWDLTLVFGDDPPALRASDAATGPGPLLCVGEAADGFRVAWLRPGSDGCARCIGLGPWRPDAALGALAGAWAASEALLGLLGRGAGRVGHEVVVSSSGVTSPPRPVLGGPCRRCGR